MTGPPSDVPVRPRFTWTEFSGSLGDLGLFIPLVVAVVLQVRLDLGIVLVAAGAMNVIAGWVFRQPIPVQPMKAIAAVAITEGLTGGELSAAGLLLGAILLALALTGAVDLLRRFVPKAVVRGIQLGVGLKLAAKGAAWVGALPLVGWDSVFVALIVGALLLLLLARRLPGLLPLFAAGLLLVLLLDPTAWAEVTWRLPRLALHWPAPEAWAGGFLRGTLPQLPLTLLNSVIAVCALSSDYFPGRGIAPRRMAASVGLMNLCCVPFGAIPMCHGAGGLAAQVRFGSRTGGGVIMLGVLKIGIGLAFGSALLPVLDAYPVAILGPMLVFAGIELARSVGDLSQPRLLAVALVTAAVILGVNTGAGFLVGWALHAAMGGGAARDMPAP